MAFWRGIDDNKGYPDIQKARALVAMAKIMGEHYLCEAMDIGFINRKLMS